MYSKYAGTELDFNGSKHLILKDDDIVGILETDDVKDLKPLNDRVLIKVCFLLMFITLVCSSSVLFGVQPSINKSSCSFKGVLILGL